MDDNPFATPATDDTPPAVPPLSAGRFTFLLTFTQLQFIAITLFAIYGILFTLPPDLPLEDVFTRLLIGVSVMCGLLTGVIRLTSAIAGQFVPLAMPTLCTGASLYYLTAAEGWFPGYVVGLVIVLISLVILSAGYPTRLLCLIASNVFFCLTYYGIFMSSSIFLKLGIAVLILSFGNWVMFTKMCHRSFNTATA